MSQILAELNGNELKIQCQRSRMKEMDTEIIDVRTLIRDKKYTSYVKVHNTHDKNMIFFWQDMQLQLFADAIGVKDLDEDTIDEMGTQEQEHYILFVIRDQEKIFYGYMRAVKAYKLLIGFTYRLINISLRNRCLRLKLLCYVTNRQDSLPLEKIRFYIDEKNQVPLNLNVYPAKISKLKAIKENRVKKIAIPLENLLTDETQINNMLNMMVTVDGYDLDFRIGLRKRRMTNIRKYYAPYKSCRLKGFAIHLRRTDRGNFAIVKRPIEDVERTLWFKFMESKLVSALLYYIGKAAKQISSKKVNLFYEKFAEKAEEGTFDLFKMARDRNVSACYYIIDSKTSDYEKIKNEKNVVKKYSLKYYWLIYRVNHYIATEAPAHLNVLRSNNKYFRISTCENPFVFLQHGVTYLKCQGEGSTFVKGKEGEPSYMIVGSEKERDVVCDMLRLSEECVLNTGLPIFSKISYGHINEQTPDKAVIMLTWKSYEEHIMEFEKSEYYKNVMDVYHLLAKYIAPENIIIIPHPKMAELCENTPLNDMMWKKPISEVLGIAKLLITDYSSVCYNSFYQGGGVIFYQPDLELYEREAGKLIPEDDEYIGPRLFDLASLDAEVSKHIKDGKITLQHLRTEEYLRRYCSINEFSDGKNIDRIAKKLIKLEII